jgi:uncharacterized protein YkwD
VCMAAKKTLLRLALGFAAIAALTAAPSASATTPCPNAGTLAGLTSFTTYNDAVLCLLNEQRANAGLPPLTVNAGLEAAALGHSQSMRDNGYFGHDSPDGTTFDVRIAQTGFLSAARGWLIGENIGWGSFQLSTPRAVITAWMNSPEHRDNILEPGFREIGVGTVWGTPSSPILLTAAIVTTDFGHVQYRVKRVRKSKRAKRAHRSVRKRARR